MKSLLAPVLMILMLVPARAADTTLPDLDSFLWLKRPIVIFANTEADPRLAQQLAMFEKTADLLDERDVVIIVDTDPGARSPLRQRLRPRDFQFVLIGKDGEIKYRRPKPVTVREITRIIDRMPLRRQEIEQGRIGGSG